MGILERERVLQKPRFLGILHDFPVSGAKHGSQNVDQRDRHQDGVTNEQKDDDTLKDVTARNLICGTVA